MVLILGSIIKGLSKLKLKSITKQIKIWCAGPLSEMYYSKESGSQLSGKDSADINELVQWCNIEEDKRESIIDWIKSKTKEMIVQNWILVEPIAQKLLEKKKLTRKEIESLMKKHH